MWNKLKAWLDYKERLPPDNHNESTRTWSKGYHKAFRETSEFVADIKPANRKPLIIGVLTIVLLSISFFALYIDYTKININSASIESLESLPDIGPVLAKRIVDGRPYEDVWALDRVKGIGPETIKAIEGKVKARGF